MTPVTHPLPLNCVVRVDELECIIQEVHPDHYAIKAQCPDGWWVTIIDFNEVAEVLWSPPCP